jgi:ribose transport system substrate-binding protein
MRCGVYLTLCAGLGLGCTGEPPSSPETGSEAPSEAINPFYPVELQQAIDLLTVELGEQPGAGDVRVGVVANRHGNFWTPAQIGTGRAASALGCVATFDAPAGGTSEEQVAILDGLVAEGLAGFAVSAIEPTEIEPSLQAAVEQGVHVMTMDSDAAPGSVRPVYLGTLNRQAGRLAGQAMAELLPSGGEVALFAGFETAANAIERMEGIEEVFAETGLTVVARYYDGIDPVVARDNVHAALDAHPELDGIIGIYANNGPAALQALEERGQSGQVRLVAFDLEPATLDGLEAGTVDAAIGQRPYWFGYLSTHILYTMEQLGEARTLELLEPWLDGQLFDTGADVVRPDTIETYRAYLETLGISSS